jgi:hypothetical protein
VKLATSSGLAILLAVSLASDAAQAKSGKPARHSGYKAELIRIIADATAWSEMCVNYAVDPAALAFIRDAHRIKVNGPYIKTYGYAHARQHGRAYENNRFYNACERALALYGPYGSVAPGLVRPLFHGTVPDQKIDLDRW